MSQDKLKENNHADQDINSLLKATLNKIVLNIGQQQHEPPVTKNRAATFETKELMVLNDAGLLVYRKSKIFSDMLAVIKKVIREGGVRSKDEPFVIQTDKLTTLITHGNGFNIVIVGLGNQVDSITPDAKQVCRVISDSGIMHQFSSRVANLTAAEDSFLALRSRMPRSFADFFIGGN